MRSIILTLSFLTVIVDVLLGQQQFVYQNELIVDTLFSIRKLNENEINFDKVFPASLIYDKDIKGGVNIVDGVWPKNQLKLIPIGKFEHKIKTDTTLIIHKAFFQNVRGYYIYLYNYKDEKWCFSYFNVPYDGYQEAVFTYVSKWKEVEDPETLSLLKEKEKLLYLSPKLRDGNHKVKISFGSFIIGENILYAVSLKDRFFKNLVKRGISYPDPQYFSLGEKNISCVDSPKDFVYGNPPGNIQIVPNDTAFHEPLLFKLLIQEALDSYFFYKEKGLNKLKIIEDYHNLLNKYKDKEFCELINAVKAFISITFKDPHFGVIPPKICDIKDLKMVKGPIRLYEIENNFFVAAILNSSYKKQVNLGDQVLAINKIPIEQIIDNLLATGKVSSNRVVAELIKSDISETMTISILDSAKQLHDVEISFGDQLEIPDNFRSKHGQFQITDNIGYFEISNWTLDVPIRLINERERLDSLDGLILDLRGNGGGELLSALRVFSLFIKEITPFCEISDLSNENIIQDLKIAPHENTIFNSKSPIVVLVDKNTACTSESFIMAMKKLPNVVVIGSEKTSGTLAGRFDIVFPSTLTVFINSLFYKMSFNGGESLEGKGIEPDINIKILNVRDLRPYEDKVKQSAIEIIKFRSKI